jgi:hypothetical protein
MTTRRWLLLVALGGCTDALPSTSTVDVLRILALTTTTPEVRPGGGVSVRALWFDPVGGRAVRWRWRLCDPGVADDPRVCARATGAIELSSGESDRVEIATANLGTSDRTWVVHAIACPGAEATIDPREGRLVCPEGIGSEAFRRVTVRSTGELNRPPGIARWTLGHAGQEFALEDGGTALVGGLAACDGDCPEITLTLTPADDAAEATESLLGSVYVTSGAVAPPRAVNDPGLVGPMVLRWKPQRVVLGGEVARVWAVLRDQRGGESARSVIVTAP